MTLPGQYTLSEVIDRLRAEDPQRRLPLGFRSPHSHRGDYSDLAFEPAENITVGEMLAAAESALGATYQGYKGGDYTMDSGTPVWLAVQGRCGETLGVVMLDLMLAAPPATPGGHHFHFSVTTQPEGADWVGEPFQLTVRAWSLPAACTKAAAVRLADWTHPAEDPVNPTVDANDVNGTVDE